jgi:hypothetical protein
MQMPVTSNHMISIVLNETTKDFQFQAHRTMVQKALFYGAIVCIVVGALTGGASVALENRLLAFAGIGAFYAGAAAVLLYQGALIWTEVRTLKNPEKAVALPLTTSFTRHMELIHNLASFQTEHLGYARDIFRRDARHLRERIGVMVGALDKVGAIPLAVTSYLSYAKIAQDSGSFGAIEVIGLAFVAFYMFAIRMVMTAQWMEAVESLFEHALAARRANELARSAPGRVQVHAAGAVPDAAAASAARGA